ncbi:MAG: DUF2459 domain-containing protein [Candidatus Kapabacteria bacterium]|nr:DUF2459 domain-containing protein [Candidatus Kapabacteria bacterium]
MRRLTVAQVSVGLGLALLVAATLPLRRAHAPTESSQPHVIALINHGYHMGLVLPARTEAYDLVREFGLAGSGDVVEIGWGDSTFYTMNAAFDLGLATKALFGGSRSSVFHLVLRHRDPANDVPLGASATDLAVIVTTLRRTTKRHDDGRPWVIGNGHYGPSSVFVRAHGAYSVLNTCNQWTSDMLLATGRSMPLWCPLPQSVIWNVEASSATLAMLRP